MSKAKKLALTFLSVLFALTFMLGMVACGGQSAKDAIDAYLLPQDNALVDEDFTLPRKIGIDNGVEVTWKSDNAAITIENGKTADTYNAKVTLQDEVTPVKLTISAGGASKDFTVRVNELSVYTFMNKYTNAAFSKTLSEDFDLDSSFTIQGKTATIVWSVDEKYQTYLEVDPVEPTAGQTQKAIVKPGDDVVKVKITGTFTYGDADPVTQDYELSISPVLDYRQIVNKMYSEANFPIDFAGYVVHVYVAENSEQYGPMATVFAVDEQFGYGYYIWQAALESAEQVSKVKVGAHFTFSGDFTKNYNGLWESNGYEEGTAVFDGKGDKTAEEMEASIRAMDVDIISGVQSAQWQMSRLVSLSGWKVKTAAQVDKNSNVYLTLENGSATVDVYSSIYVATDDDAMTALKAKLNGLEVGAIIDIKGILGYNNSGSTFNTKYFRIQPRSADDITVKTDATEATAYADAAKIKAAQEEVNKVVTANFNSIIMEPKADVEIPTSKEGVTISYRLARSNTAGAATVISGNKITVTPTKAEQNNLIEVTYTIGDAANPTYQAYSLFTIRSWQATDSEVVDEVYNELIAQRISQITSAGDVTLPKAELYGKATVTWSFVIDKDHVEDNWKDWAKLSGSKLVIDYLPDNAITLRLNAHIVCGSSEKDLTFNAKVSAAPTVAFEAITEAKAGTYKFAMYSGNKKATYYATGAMDGYYFATTTDNTKAADFVIKQIGTANQYTIQVNGKYLEFAARSDGSKGVDIKMNDTQTTGKYWQWVEAIQNFVFESTYNESGAPDATDLYYFGNYSTNTSMSGNYIGRITTKSGDVYTANGKEGVDQWVAHFGKIIELTDELRADEILARCEPSQTTFVDGGNYELFTTKQYNAQITYSLANTAPDNITLDGTTLQITLPATGKVQAELTVTVKVGNVTKTERYTIIAKMYDGAGTSENPFTVEDAIVIGKKLQAQGGTAYYKAAGESDPTRVYITGYVTDVGKPNNYNGAYQGVQDVLIASTAGGTATLKLSFVYYDNTVMVKQGDGSVNPLHVGDQVVVWGWLESYLGGAATVYSYKKDNTTTYPVFTSWTKTNLSNEEKAKEVAGLIPFNTKEFYEGDADVAIPALTAIPHATEYSATIEWTPSNTTYLEITGTTSKSLHLKANPTGNDPVEVTLTATVKVGSDTATATFTIKVYPHGVTRKGTATNPYTVTEALAAGKGLSTATSEQFYVKGKIVLLGNMTSFGNIEGFYIVDSDSYKAGTTYTKDSEGVMQVYRLELNGVCTLEDLYVGNEIVVKGYLQEYSGKVQVTYNNNVTPKNPQIVKYNDTVRTNDQKIAAAIAAAKKTLNADGDTVEIDATMETLDLPASAITGVTLTYAVSGNGATLSQDGKKLTFTHTSAAQTATLTINVGAETKATLTLNIAAEVPINEGDYAYDFKDVTAGGDVLSTDALLKDFKAAATTNVVVSVDTVSYVYGGNNTGSGQATDGGFLRMGTSKNNGTLTLTFKKPIDKIVIECLTWNATSTDKLSVNSSAVQQAPNTKGNLTFEFYPTTEVTITSAGRVFVYKITVSVDNEWTDAEKIAAAKAEVSAKDYIQTEYLEAKEYTLPEESNGATITWSVKENQHSDIVAISDGKTLNIKSLPASETQVILVAHITSGEATAEDVEITITIAAGYDFGDRDGTAAHPYTVADIRRIAEGLDKDTNDGYLVEEGGSTKKQVYVTGYVVNAGTWAENFSNFTGVYISDTQVADGGNADKIQVYRLKLNANTGLKLWGDLATNNRITVYGFIQNGDYGVQVTYNGVSGADNGEVDVTTYAYTDTRTADAKADAAIAIAKKAIGTNAPDGASTVTLPASAVMGVTLAYSGTGITENTLTATLGTADVKVTITITATCEGTTSAHSDTIVDFTFPAQTTPQVTLTGAGLGLTTGSSYTSSTEDKTVDSVSFAWSNCKQEGSSKSNIQMNQSKTSQIWNKTAFTENVKKVVFKYDATNHSGGPSSTSTLTVEFSTTADFTAGENTKSVTVTISSGSTANVSATAPGGGSYKFVRITAKTGGALYFSSIEIH